MDISRGVKEYAEVNLALRSGPGEVLVIPAIHVSVSKNIKILHLLGYWLSYFYYNSQDQG